MYPVTPTLRSHRDTRPRFEYYPVDSPNLRTIHVEDTPFIIGRCESASLQIHSTSVSREHAELVRTPTGYRLRDLESTNGTSINGQPISDSPLVDGDSVSVADIELTFVCSSMGRLQRTLTRPLAKREQPVATVGMPAELAAVRAMNEALLFQVVPFEWRSFVERLSGASHATTARISLPLSEWMANADGREDVAVSSRLEQLAWQMVADRADDHDDTGKLLLRIAHRERFDDGLIQTLDRASDWLQTPLELGVIVNWEWATSTPDAARTCAQIKQHGYLLAFDEFSGGGTCVESMEQAPPNYLVLAGNVARGAAEQPRRLQRIEIVQAHCDACGIRLVLPEGVQGEDELAFGQFGIELIEQGAATKPDAPRSLVAASVMHH